MRRATFEPGPGLHRERHFYPRSPCGERQWRAEQVIGVLLFLSTLSLRRATSLRASISGRASFLSTLSLRRATKERKVLIADVYIFRSTLSLRRATRSRGSPRILVRDFYPRSPCGERPPDQRAAHGTSDFYPRSPCGERLVAQDVVQAVFAISIHALLAESDDRPEFY